MYFKIGVALHDAAVDPVEVGDLRQSYIERLREGDEYSYIPPDRRLWSGEVSRRPIAGGGTARKRARPSARASG
jgi:hypothetical protein